MSRQQRRNAERQAKKKQREALRGRGPGGSVNALLEEATQLHGAGRLEEAILRYDRILAERPDLPDALHLKGIARAQSGHFDDGIALIRRAIELDGSVLDYHQNLGKLFLQAGRLAEALVPYRAAAAIAPQDAGLQGTLGVLLQEVGELAESAAALRRAVALDPSSPEARNNLGNVLKQEGDLEGAEAELRRAVEMRPDYANAYHNLGNVLIELNKVEEGVEALGRATRLQPDHAQAFANLAAGLNLLERPEEGSAAARRAIELSPGMPEAHNNLGAALRASGDVAGAEAAYRQAIAVDPRFSRAHSNLIYILDFNPDYAVRDHQAERRKWQAQHAAPLAQEIRPHANSPDPERRLRIGYVSADFRRHSAANGFGPMIMSYDRSAFDVICYASNALQDEVTAQFRGAATDWRDCARLGDAQLAQTIRDDRIDILVDLSGHSAGNRLLTFARKPAPVQATAWGFATSTGLEAIDYFLADSVIVPESERAIYTEEVLYLPCLMSYLPPAHTPEVSEAPVRRNGFVTLGSFNRLEKMGAGALTAWAEILRRNPSVRLVVKSQALDRPASRSAFEAQLLGLGVDRNRLTLLGGDPQAVHLAKHSLVDLMLDPFPHAGGISAADALWMGVPVVSLSGKTTAGRIGASALHALGLDRLIATSEEDYIETVLGLVDAPETLIELRGSLRGRMQASPFGDAARYVRSAEAIYREIWRRWCAGERRPSLPPSGT